MSQTQTQTQQVPVLNASSPTPSTTGPAVSARILKKRETDRKCQRMIRERTKSRIAYLEGLVEQFRQQDGSGRIETLMAQLSEMKTERDNLAKKVKTIESIISDGQAKQEQNSRTITQDSVSEHTPPDSRTSPFDNFATEQPNESTYKIYNKEFEARANVSKSTWASTPCPPRADEPCECSKPISPSQKMPFNKWRYANDTLTEWFKWPQHFQEMTGPEELNDDVPVRAVVEGWDAVEERGNVHPSWQLLRGIDQNIFGMCEQRERLAILQVMGLLLRAHLNPTTEHHSKLPSFYLKRPSQDMLHAYATEYFAWPGLRERFVFSEHRYCSNVFWKVFCESLRLQWPYEMRDCYVKNTETGLYKISPTFNERISDIKHWTMGREMFKLYPELYGDLPACNHVPASLVPCSNGRQRLLQAPPAKETVLNENQTARSDKETTNLRKSRSGNAEKIGFSNPSVEEIDFVQSTMMPPAGYDFVLATMAQGMEDNQQLHNFGAWEYSGSLDAFHLDAA